MPFSDDKNYNACNYGPFSGTIKASNGDAGKIRGSLSMGNQFGTAGESRGHDDLVRIKQQLDDDFNETLPYRVGRVIYRIRTARGLTQEELANAVGITQANVSQIEKGKRSTDLKLLHKFANAFSIPLSILVDLADPRVNVAERLRNNSNAYAGDH